MAQSTSGTFRATRRAFLGTGAIAALALAGCGGGGSDTASSGRPTRIVSVYPTTVDALYDFGADPVGVYDVGAENVSPRYRAAWQKAAKIGEGGELDLAKIAALEPDLIVAADYEWNTNYRARLSKVARTVITPSSDWREATHAIAAAVGAFRKLSEMQKELERRSAEIRNRFGRQLDAYRWDLVEGGGEGGEYLVFGPESGPGGVLTGAGVRLASGSAKVSGGEDASYSAVGVSGGLEGVTNASEIDVLADAGVIAYRSDWEANGPKNEMILFAQPEFQELAAVKAARLVPLPDFLPQGYGDALALLDQLEAGLKQLAT